MITLYTKTNCVFSTMIIHELEELGVPFEEKDVADPGIADELVARGGELQTPYLVDTEAGVEMYNSAPIMEHLLRQYAKDL